MRIPSILLASMLLATPVHAESRYSTWSDPDAKPQQSASSKQDGDMNKLIGELNALVDDAIKARAANPVFLEDLKALARKYSTPWPRRLVSEVFKDGDFTRNPVWTVTSGEYRIEKGWGLRSVAVAATSQGSTRQSNSASDDPAAALLGVLLQSALGGKNQTRTPPPRHAASVIHTNASIDNAFDISFEISSWKPAGQFSLGPFQGQRREAGYRLAYTPGHPIELARVNSRGASLIDTSTGPVNLEDKKVHKMRWTRSQQGRMTITLDNKVLIDISDRSFRDPFQGLVIINNGTDVIVKTVTVNDAG
jgi:hypothetical protein